MHVDLNVLTERERYKLLMSSVLPRPIALVSSVDEKGQVNAAPFSCFNLMGTTPATVVLGIDSRSPGISKDTVRNVQLTGEFVINMVSEDIIDRMNLCSAPLPPDEDELKFAGLTAARSVQVATPRIEEAPISLECKRTTALDIGHGRTIILANILHYHIQDRFYDRETGYVLADRIGLVARMHGKSWYARTTDLFEIARPAGSSTGG
jgi:flavin reductase (DIM6/NTAB) family NADH-FMN oxidoreductase RutF